MTRIRTFIAIPLEKPIRKRLVGLQEDLSRAREIVREVVEGAPPA